MKQLFSFRKKNINDDIIKARKIVAALIIDVLVNKICTREAIKKFPPEIQDPSIICTWHALVHYEADEDFRKKDQEYLKEQNNYLEMIAFILKEGKPLPKNIIEGYNAYYDHAAIPRSSGFISLIKSLLRFTI